MTSPTRVEATLQLLTVMAGAETFGLPVAQVQTIFHIGAITPVPLGPSSILGLVNLRGSIIPALSLRRCLGLGGEHTPVGALAVALELDTEAFALLVDDVGDVISLPAEQALPLPPHVSDARAALTQAVYRLPDGVLPVLDVSALVALPALVAPSATAELPAPVAFPSAA